MSDSLRFINRQTDEPRTGGGAVPFRKRKGTDINNGGVAQLGEHLPCKQGVRGSNPLISRCKEGQEKSCNGLIAQLVRARA